MNSEPEFLTVGEVLQIHDAQLAAYGRASGIPDLTQVTHEFDMNKGDFGIVDVLAALSRQAVSSPRRRPGICR
jgi:hypothetical protein